MTNGCRHFRSDPPRIGILGGGQLGRMTALAAIRMGVSVRTLSPESSAPVEGLGESMTGDWTRTEVLESFAGGCDVITVESEWAPADLAARIVGPDIPVLPRPRTLEQIRHKGVQKDLLLQAGIPQAPYRRCESIEEAQQAAAELGYPVVLKKYQGSYDGYGNALANSESEIRSLWPLLSGPDGILVEGWIDFKREIATLVARRPGGEGVIYPLVDTIQRDHRCHAVLAPGSSDSEITSRARDLAVRCAEAVDSVGILGVELFETRDGSVLVNELAPRPHNTGHYTIEACHTSQFENHVRAILDWPLGNPDLIVDAAVMVNILGRSDSKVSLESIPDALQEHSGSIHIYGKTDSRPGRKMGHVTVTASDTESARRYAESIVSRILI